MLNTQAIESAKEHFGTVLAEQLDRVERLLQEGDWIDYSKVDPIVIGMIGGDGIGPSISEATQRVLEYLLQDAVDGGKVRFRTIEGLTIENRAAKMKSIPDDVLAEIRDCHVTLKGPTHTPEKGDGWPNIESANVSMRKALDLFANVRDRFVSRQRASTGPFSARTPRTCTPSAARASTSRTTSPSTSG